MNTKKIKLVTGGCGFVGRHLVQSILADGDDVWILDNLFTGKDPDLWLRDFAKKQEDHFVIYQKGSQKVIFVKQDAIDFFRLHLSKSNQYSLPRFDEVYHLAAIVGGRAVLIEQDPMFVATNHVIDSLFFLWATRSKDHIDRLLYVSTSVSYPKSMQDKTRHVAMKEEYLQLNRSETVGLPESIYGWIKLVGEYLGIVAAEKYGLSVVAVRPFSGYGEDQDLDYPIPSIAARAAKREDPLTVWGSGNQGRDFIYIDDFVSALRIAIQQINNGSAVNIGGGRLTTFHEVAEILARLEGYNPKIVGLTDKIEGSFAVYSDPTYLKSLGWRQTYSLEEGLKKVLDRIKSTK